jgi:hypothetical protein
MLISSLNTKIFIAFSVIWAVGYRAFPRGNVDEENICTFVDNVKPFRANGAINAIKIYGNGDN